MQEDITANNKQYDEQQVIKDIYSLILNNSSVSRIASSGISDNITSALGFANESHGIKINKDDSELNIVIHIIVYYGENIPQLSYDLQSGVKNLIEDNYEDIEVKSINISVDGIDRRRG